MSSEEVAEKGKEAWKAVKNILEKAEQTVHKELQKAAPVVQRSLDSSLETASKAFSASVKTIDSRTEPEQLGLIRAYKKFLAAQLEYLDGKLKSLEDRAKAKK